MEVLRPARQERGMRERSPPPPARNLRRAKKDSPKRSAPDSRKEIEVEEPPPGWVDLESPFRPKRGAAPASSKPASAKLLLKQQAGPFRPATRTRSHRVRRRTDNCVYVPSFHDPPAITKTMKMV